MAIPQTRRVVTTDAAGNLPATVLGSIPAPTFAAITGKPAVIAAGATQAVARDAIGAAPAPDWAAAIAALNG